MADKGVYTYDYPRPAFCVDAVVLGLDPGLRELYVLLIERGEPPFKGKLAFPGGHVEMQETIRAACSRELQEETGLKIHEGSFCEVGTFGDPDRDPRGRVISTVFMTLVLLTSEVRASVKAGSDAAKARWVSVWCRDAQRHTQWLAFDHAQILFHALNKLRMMSEEPADHLVLGMRVLPEPFTLTELQVAQETLMTTLLPERPEKQFWKDKRNFRAAVKDVPCIVPVPGSRVTRAGGRPAQGYRHDHTACHTHYHGF